MPRIYGGDYYLSFDVTRGSGGRAKWITLLPGVVEQLGELNFSNDFCAALLRAGFSVIRIEYRGTGNSVYASSEIFASDYSLQDLAQDTVRVLDHLSVRSTHLLGVCIGSSVARWISLLWPKRVLSLAIAMGTCGDCYSEDVLSPNTLTKKAMRDVSVARTEAEHSVWKLELWRKFWGRQYQFPEEELRSRTETYYRRAYDPAAISRQVLAIKQDDGLIDRQSEILCPTLVIHGNADPYIRPDHARKIARKIGASSLWFPKKMGHVFPAELHEEIVTRVVRNAVTRD